MFWNPNIGTDDVGVVMLISETRNIIYQKDAI